MLKFRSYLKLSYLFIALFSISCNNGLYNPVNENVDPAISQGELNASFNTNISNYFTPQAGISYSPIKNFNFTYSTLQGFAQKSHSISAGWYLNRINDATEKKTSAILVNGGYGLGSNKYQSEYYDIYDFKEGVYIGKYNKFFLQMSYIAQSKNFGFMASARAVYLDWYNLTFIDNSGPFSYPGIQPLDDISKHDPYHFQELTFRFNAKQKAFKVFTLMNIRIPAFDNKIDFNSLNIGVGCSLNLKEFFMPVKVQ